MKKKYELSDWKLRIDGHHLNRIRALRDFNDVKVGDLGGFVSSEDNLSHDGDCWIYNDAQVSGHAQVFENAKIFGGDICSDARVYGNAQVHGSSVYLCGNSNICGNARIYGRTDIDGSALICGDAWIIGTEYIRVVGPVKLDRGVWTRMMKIGRGYYLISSTLERMSLGYG